MGQLSTCVHGHKLSERDVRKNGYIRCLTCHKLAERKRRARHERYSYQLKGQRYWGPDVPAEPAPSNIEYSSAWLEKELASGEAQISGSRLTDRELAERRQRLEDLRAKHDVSTKDAE